MTWFPRLNYIQQSNVGKASLETYNPQFCEAKSLKSFISHLGIFGMQEEETDHHEGGKASRWDRRPYL